jgi:hypothetical protein
MVEGVLGVNAYAESKSGVKWIGLEGGLVGTMYLATIAVTCDKEGRFERCLLLYFNNIKTRFLIKSRLLRPRTPPSGPRQPTRGLSPCGDAPGRAAPGILALLEPPGEPFPASKKGLFGRVDSLPNFPLQSA